MNEFNNDNLNDAENVTGEGDTDELKFSNLSTKEYMAMMAEKSGNADHGADNDALNSYSASYQHSAYNGSNNNTEQTSYYGGQTDNVNTTSYYGNHSGNTNYYNAQSGNTGYYTGQTNNAGSTSFQTGYNMYGNAGTSKPGKEKKTKVKKAKKKSGKAKVFFKKAVALVACGAIFGGVAGGVFNVVTRDNNTDGKNNKSLIESLKDTESTSEALSIGSDYEIPGTAVVSDGQVDSQSLDVSDIAENVMPSVVSITIKSITEYNAGFFGQTYEYESEGSGSGIIIGENDEELLIVTNNHVVADAETVTVAFIDDQVYEAKVKGTDSASDLAIIVVDLEDISAETMSQIKIATIGNSDDIKVGEQVVAIGNALGYGQSVTTGIVSAKDRTNDTNSTPLIQTDAAINPGNSGGALLNMRGEVIGINSSKMASTDVEGMGYAIPITQVESIIGDLMNRETREKVDEDERGYLGIACQTISEDASYMYGLPVGALVSEVTEGSAAEKAGIKKSHIITSFDGQTVSSAEGLVSMLEYYEAGETVEVVIMYLDDDEYKEKTVSVTLGSRSK